MARPRTSVIWKMPADEFRTLVARCRTMSEVLNHFGLQTRGHNYRTFMQRIAEEEIDITHLKANRFQKMSDPVPLEDVLTNKRPLNTFHLKRKLFKAGLLAALCSECGIGPEWNSKPLSLHLDHINGDRTDNRLENLRLLCPNCHSQTATYAGKAREGQKEKRPIGRCTACDSELYHQTKSGLCLQCYGKTRRVTPRPDTPLLREQVAKMGYTGAGRFYGVSDNAIRKWLRQ